jgi:glutaredoxin
MHDVVVYSRKGCHLCEVVKETITKIQSEADFQWREVDIDARPELQQQYANEVPVLFIDGRKGFNYRMNANDLLRALAARELNENPYGFWAGTRRPWRRNSYRFLYSSASHPRQGRTSCAGKSGWLEDALIHLHLPLGVSTRERIRDWRKPGKCQSAAPSNVSPAAVACLGVVQHLLCALRQMYRGQQDTGIDPRLVPWLPLA